MMGAKAKLVSFVLLLALMATPMAGCTGNLPPTADFLYSPPSPNTGQSILFTDNSTDDGFIASWNWDFGDGNTSTIQNPAHSFAAAGTYAVSLTVTDDGGASDSYTVNITVTSPPEIGAWDAIEILVGELIPPASAYERISAFMLSEPLQAGDVVSSASGATYSIDANTWFIFIDDLPEAFYAHATRYVFMDAVTADYDIVNESWPPEINGFSMWDTQNVGRGHLIEVYSILDNPAPVASSASNAPSGDYGDAPDGQVELYYGITARFPTLFNTTNSHFGRPGGHTLNVGEETLGLNVSAEVDALDPSDPDGVPNLVDADSDERIYAIMEGTKARLAFTVSVSSNAPDMTRYANALIDFDQSGNWSTGNYGVEWVVVNLGINVDPGDSETIITPEFSWGNQLLPPTEVWMRLALTRAEVDESLFANVGGWDGSGQYAYGEIEDKFVFLTDSPPPPPDGDGDGDGNGPPPPGEPTGPCGYEINYYALIINCGDMYKHMAQGMPIGQSAASTMESVLQNQGYTLFDVLGPGQGGISENTLANIGLAFDDLASLVNCGDRVLIYICGHSGQTGGIILYNSQGARTGEELTPTDLGDLLDKIPACPGEDCNLAEKCCHVSVIIESCYGGKFNVPGVTGPGRAVAGSSTNTPSQGIYPGGGIYTAGFGADLRDPGADKSTPPNGVDPMEAHASADDAVKNHPRGKKGKQEPWSDNQWCLCTCPCQPGIDVEKWIWYDLYEMWVDEIEVEPGVLVDFVLEIENDGNCRDIIDIEIIDYLPYCLDYDPDSFFLYYNGVLIGPRPPDVINQVADGLELIWYLEEIDSLSPGGFISIEYYAYAIYPGANVNILFGSAHCSYNYENVVSDQDSATVWVQQEPIEEEVLYGELNVEYYCYCEDSYCAYCNLLAEFYAQDISVVLGPYPVTNVALYLGVNKVFDSGPINETYYAGSYSIPQAECATTYTFTMIATNSIGLTVTVTKPITTPFYCPQQ
jgi:PKD repeat protein